MKELLIEGLSLEWLLVSATDAMLIIDDGGKIVVVNPAVLRLFGYTHEELVGQTIEILVPARYRHVHGSQRTDYFSNPRPRAMGGGAALFGQHRDGREFPVEVSLSPLQTSQKHQLVMATIHDITHRKEAETALQESEARMRAIFETAVDAIITIDELGVLERLNPAAERLFGYAEAEVAGNNVSMLMPAPHRERHDGYLAHYMQTGEKKIIGKGREVEGLRKDGTVFPMDLAVAEMRLGERRMFTGIVRDISERKRAEQALRQSQQDLRKLAAHQENIKEQERKRIAQEIHDELGGLLTGIRAHINVSIDRAAQAGAAPDKLLVDAAELTKDAIETVRKVITDLRPSVLDQLGIWAALEWYAEQMEKRFGLACECNIDAPAAAMELDAERSTMLFRVVQESLTNVMRHAQASRVTIQVKLQGTDLFVEVRDNGIGIATERLHNRESWGILGMIERTRHFGGELKITGKAGEGTIVLLHLSLENLNGQ